MGRYKGNIGLVPEFTTHGGAKAGINVYSVSLISALSKVDSPFYFTVFVNQAYRHLFPDLGEKFRLISCRKPRNTLANIFWYFFVLPLKARKKGVDILHLFSGNRRLSFFSFKKTLVTVHDLFHYRDKRLYGFFRYVFFRCVILGLLRFHKHIVAISWTTASEIQQILNIPSSHIAVVKNGYSKRQIGCAGDDKTIREVRRKYSLDNDFILYVSCLEHPRKNHVNFIRAYTKLRGYYPSLPDLIFVGDEVWQAESIYEEIERSRAGERIKCLGYIPDQELALIYRLAKLFVHPSFFEGFGLPLLEAMGAGLPAVCSDIAVFHEVGGDAVLFFDPSDPDDIADKLKTLLDDPSRCEELAAMGLERAERFSWDKTAREMVEVYKKVLYSL